MCKFNYYQYGQCGHRVIEAQHYCEKAQWNAGLTGKIVLCEEIVFKYHLNHAIDPTVPLPQELSREAVNGYRWYGLTGICKPCAIDNKLPAKTTTFNGQDALLSTFYHPTMLARIKSHHNNSASIGFPIPDHPLIFLPELSKTVFNLLGISTQYNGADQSKSKLIVFPSSGFLYTQEKWLSHGWADGEKLTHSPHLYFFNNSGLTPMDRKYVADEIGRGVSLDEVYSTTYAHRGIPKFLFTNSIISGEVLMPPAVSEPSKQKLLPGNDATIIREAAAAITPSKNIKPSPKSTKSARVSAQKDAGKSSPPVTPKRAAKTGVQKSVASPRKPPTPRRVLSAPAAAWKVRLAAVMDNLPPLTHFSAGVAGSPAEVATLHKTLHGLGAEPAQGQAAGHIQLATTNNSDRLSMAEATFESIVARNPQLGEPYKPDEDTPTKQMPDAKPMVEVPFVASVPTDSQSNNKFVSQEGSHIASDQTTSVNYGNSNASDPFLGGLVKIELISNNSFANDAANNNGLTHQDLLHIGAGLVNNDIAYNGTLFSDDLFDQPIASTFKKAATINTNTRSEILSFPNITHLNGDISKNNLMDMEPLAVPFLANTMVGASTKNSLPTDDLFNAYSCDTNPFNIFTARNSDSNKTASYSSTTFDNTSVATFDTAFNSSPDSNSSKINSPIDEPSTNKLQNFANSEQSTPTKFPFFNDPFNGDQIENDPLLNFDFAATNNDFPWDFPNTSPPLAFDDPFVTPSCDKLVALTSSRSVAGVSRSVEVDENDRTLFNLDPFATSGIPMENGNAADFADDGDAAINAFVNDMSGDGSLYI